MPRGRPHRLGPAGDQGGRDGRMADIFIAYARSTPAAATVTTLSSATNAAIVLTSQTSGAGSGAGTLTNAPSAGNPGFWLALKINGTTYHVPAW